MRRWIWLAACLCGAAWADVGSASAQTAHFRRVVAAPPDADPEGWRARTELRLRRDVEALEAALPGLREGFPAARALLPLDAPGGIPRTLDLTGQGWALVEVSFREEPPPVELETLRRAMAQSIQIRPLERRPRPVRFILGGLFAVAVTGGAVVWWRRRRRQP